MNTIRIFLASSSELSEDRLQIERLLERKNRILKQHDLEFELIHWESFIDTVSETRLQDEYNKSITNCDLFVLLVFTKIGKYSKEEYQKAYDHFLLEGKPRILIYFKNEEIKIHGISFDEIKSMFDFKETVRNIGHFPKYYDHVEELKNHLYDQLEKIFIRELENDDVKALSRSKKERKKQELARLEEKLNMFYKPILHRLEKDDNLWQKSSQLSDAPDALPPDASEIFEENVILPNHREIIDILKNFSHLKNNDPRLKEEIDKYERHVAIYETIRNTESMKHLNPIDLNTPFPKHFKTLILQHIDQLEDEMTKLKTGE
jgi:hypothetical protein